MATRRLYYDDSFQDNFSAQVLSCEVLKEAEDSPSGPRWGVVLDQTLLVSEFRRAAERSRQARRREC